MTTFNKEELAQDCCLFIDKNEDISEEFVRVKRITGGHIASTILNKLYQLGLSVVSEDSVMTANSKEYTRLYCHW